MKSGSKEADDRAGRMHLYYRGLLKSCNYACCYCPFSKKTDSKERLLEDRRALDRFVDEVRRKGDIGSVLITPYGEALIHEYYWEALAKLTSISSIRAAGCQTNLSFSADAMLSIFKRNQGNIKTLRLWCTFHGGMTSVEQFVMQCRLLIENEILFCVGAVGNIEDIEKIRLLREQLPKEVYLWINRLDGLKRPCTREEIQAFKDIDRHFPLELTVPSSRENLCMGGRESMFVEGNGHCFACNVSKRKLGSFYEEWVRPAHNICSSKRCSCFLAYSNRRDINDLAFFDVHPSFRIPVLNQGIKLIFIDIDGTLMNEGDKPVFQMEKALNQLSQNYRLYFATSLPYIAAMKKCAAIKKYFTGGIFADGSFNKTAWAAKPDLIFFTEPQRDEIMTLLAPYLKKGRIKCREYHFNNKTYKITVNAPEGMEITKELYEYILHKTGGKYMTVKSGNTVGIVGNRAGKLEGILRLMKESGYTRAEAAVIGNDDNDVPMLQYFPCSAAVSNASPEAAGAAKYHLVW